MGGYANQGTKASSIKENRHLRTEFYSSIYSFSISLTLPWDHHIPQISEVTFHIVLNNTKSVLLLGHIDLHYFRVQYFAL